MGKKFDAVDNCIYDLSKVKKDNKVGYVNKEGVVIIKLEYEDGLTFNEGFAAVKSGRKWMYFASTGKAITEALYDDANSFSNGLAVVSKNNSFALLIPKAK